MFGLLKENIRIAFNSIKTQLLRTILTVLIIAIGITALVGILSAIDAIKNGINDKLTDMGANSFTIRNAETNIRVGDLLLDPAAHYVSRSGQRLKLGPTKSGTSMMRSRMS